MPEILIYHRLAPRRLFSQLGWIIRDRREAAAQIFSELPD
jgi:hypothetical protein